MAAGRCPSVPWVPWVPWVLAFAQRGGLLPASRRPGLGRTGTSAMPPRSAGGCRIAERGVSCWENTGGSIMLRRWVSGLAIWPALLTVVGTDGLARRLGVREEGP